MRWNHLRSGALALLVGVAASVLSACGGSKAPTVATLETTTSGPAAAATTTGGAAGSSPSRAQLQSDALKYSRCMRAHGVPDFPDPSSSGGFTFQPGSGLNPSSPAVKAAQAKCEKYMGGALGGLAPGTQTHPSSQWLAQMVQAAACMRRHGYPDFPDPRTSIPSNPFGATGGNGVISNIDGVIFIFPSSIDTTSPQFYRAADKCKFPDHDH